MKAIAKILIAGLLFGRLSMVTPLSLAAATFSDANWISMGGIPGANDQVYAAIVDGSGNLYIGGPFTGVGDTVATYVAKWNGSSWSALGSGMNAYGFLALGRHGRFRFGTVRHAGRSGKLGHQ